MQQQASRTPSVGTGRSTAGRSVAETLLAPLRVGRLTLPNRIVMAPMTRHRAGPDEIPTEMMRDYYVQRASAGLIVTEGTHPSAQGRGYFHTPGLYTDGQVAGWKRITDAVHVAGGRIFVQLMHAGRIAFRETISDGSLPVAPSAVMPDPDYRGYSYSCPRPRRHYDTPRALETNEVVATIEDYRRATEHALAAGFDGVEIHGASGYLPHQFLASNTNRRTDRYGGDASGRCRMVLELMQAVAYVAGPEFVALKVAPSFRYHDVQDADPVATFSYLLPRLNEIGMAYLHVAEHDDYYSYPFDGLALARALFEGPVVASAGFTRKTAARAIASGLADLVAFGSAYIANPDLVERTAAAAPLATPDPATFYTQGATGYTNYPPMAPQSDKVAG